MAMAANSAAASLNLFAVVAAQVLWYPRSLAYNNNISKMAQNAAAGSSTSELRAR
jgi:hypothetical protein